MELKLWTLFLLKVVRPYAEDDIFVSHLSRLNNTFACSRGGMGAGSKTDLSEVVAGDKSLKK